MAAVARINKEWAVRLLLIFALAGAYCAWSLYDGFVGYPRSNDMAKIAYEDIAALRPHTDWQQRLADAGYKSNSDLPKIHSDWDIATQFVIAGISGLAALAVLVVFLRNLGRVPSSDEQSVRRGSTVVPYDAITSIDKTRWNNKGIAVLYYKSNGREGRLKLDDWIYKGAAAVLEDVEKHTHLSDTPEKSEQPA